MTGSQQSQPSEGRLAELMATALPTTVRALLPLNKNSASFDRRGNRLSSER
jgi:hypothetical protein